MKYLIYKKYNNVLREISHSQTYKCIKNATPLPLDIIIMVCEYMIREEEKFERKWPVGRFCVISFVNNEIFCSDVYGTDVYDVNGAWKYRLSQLPKMCYCSMLGDRYYFSYNITNRIEMYSDQYTLLRKIYGFHRPTSITSNSSHVYVCDNKKRIKKIDSEGDVIMTGTYPFNDLKKIIFSDNNLYVLDADSIVVMNDVLQPLKTYEGKYDSIAIRKNMCYVLENNNVWRCNNEFVRIEKMNIDRKTYISDIFFFGDELVIHNGCDLEMYTHHVCLD